MKPRVYPLLTAKPTKLLKVNFNLIFKHKMFFKKKLIKKIIFETWNFPFFQGFAIIRGKNILWINNHPPHVKYSSNIELDSVWISLICWTPQDFLRGCTSVLLASNIPLCWENNQSRMEKKITLFKFQLFFHLKQRSLCSIVGKIPCYLKAIFKTRGQCYI